VSLAFDLRLDEADGVLLADFATVRLNAPDAGERVGVYVGATGPGDWRLVSHTFLASSEGVKLLVQPDAGDWSRIRLNLNIAPDAGTMAVSSQVFVDDRSAATDTVAAGFELASIDVCIGVVYLDGPAGPWRMHFDNLTFSMTE
jgi:hypothetical protein